jgi:hypothetical protein
MNRFWFFNCLCYAIASGLSARTRAQLREAFLGDFADGHRLGLLHWVFAPYAFRSALLEMLHYCVNCRMVGRK